MKLTILFLFISLSAFSQHNTASLPGNIVSPAIPMKHDTTYVLEIDAAIWQKIQYVISKSNAEHLVWKEVDEYINPQDPSKRKIKMVVDSVIKK